MLELRELSNDLISKWDRVVYSSPGGTIFHTLKWLKLLEKNQALRIKYLGIFLSGELIGVFPLCIKNFLFIKVAGAPFFVEDTPYMGPVIAPSYIFDFFPALDAYMKTSKIRYLRIITHSFLDLKTKKDSYHFIHKYRYLLDITKTEEELWKNLKSTCRTAIRKARKSGVVVRIVEKKDFINRYYLMLEQVFQRHKKSTTANSKTFYYDLWDSFAQEKAFFLGAYHRSKIIAGLILILDRKMAYYLNGASDTGFAYLRANNLLQWEAINFARENNAEQYDFLGPDSPPLARFKKTFGSVLVPFTRIEKSNSKFVSLLRNKYPYYKEKVNAFSQIIRRNGN